MRFAKKSSLSKELCRSHPMRLDNVTADRILPLNMHASVDGLLEMAGYRLNFIAEFALFECRYKDETFLVLFTRLEMSVGQLDSILESIVVKFLELDGQHYVDFHQGRKLREYTDRKQLNFPFTHTLPMPVLAYLHDAWIRQGCVYPDELVDVGVESVCENVVNTGDAVTCVAPAQGVKSDSTPPDSQ